MGYKEAFAKLGYDLRNARQHWSCASDTGVCLSLWRKEIDWKNRKFDTREDAGPTETWNSAGANQRKRDLDIAMIKFGGLIDVVVVNGTPGEGVEDAAPWSPDERQGLRWKVTQFDKPTGHFRAELVK
jgi:hypothetical protein